MANSSSDDLASLALGHLSLLPELSASLNDSNLTWIKTSLDELAAGSEMGDPDGEAESEVKALRPNLLNHPLPLVIVMSVAYAVVFLLAVVNNSLVVSVIYRNPQMRNVTNYFLANLAIADITVSLLVLPITLLSNVFTEWQFGSFLCKAIPYLQAVAVGASCNTLAAVSLERFFAIFYPQRQFIRANGALVIIAIIWLVPMAIQLPWAFYYSLVSFPHKKYQLPLTICYPKFPSKSIERGFFLGAMFIVCYLVPLSYICIFYSLIGLKVWQRNVQGIRGTKAERNIQRSKIRIVRMLVVVAAFFACSWLPLYSIRMRILFGPEIQWEEKKVLGVLQPIAQWLGSANSCVNPFIYCYFSEQFRKGIMALLKSRSCCSKFTV